MGAAMRDETGQAGGGGGQIFLGALAASALVGAALIGWSVMGPKPDELTEIIQAADTAPTPQVAASDARNARPAETASTPETPGGSSAQAPDPEAEQAAVSPPGETPSGRPGLPAQAGGALAPSARAAEQVAGATGATDADIVAEDPPQTASVAEDTATDVPTEPVERAGATGAPQPGSDTNVTSDAAQASDAANTPRFDLVRVDGYGSTVVAGRGPSGGVVRVLLDGEMVAQAVADRRGSFVALFSLGPSTRARALTLEAESVEGTRHTSAETALVSPFSGVVADNAETSRSAEAQTVAEAPPAVATTQTPADGATDTTAPGAPALSTRLEGARAEAGQSPEFPTLPAPVADATIGADTTAPARPAPGDGPAVPRPSAPSVVIVAREGARPASPEPQPDRPGLPGVANVVIDTISYDTEGEVVLVGRALPNTQIQLYLNNRLVAQTQVNDIGLWRSRVTGIARGIYTLRADEVDASGAVLSRFETPFERALREDALRAAQAQATPAGDAAQGTAFRDYAPGARSVAGIVTVQPGFTLWRIARENYGDGFEYVRVFNSNRGRIRDPDLIYPGQVFTVPGK